jgi:ubiquinone/menaquinone biosynthesis C-methylase UbiE
VVNRWDSSHLDKVDRLLDLKPGERVLEVGCGAGHLTTRLAARGVDIVGIDANPNASAIAGTDRVRTMQAESLAFANDSFDVIVSVHAIEHIPGLEGALDEMARVLRPGGRVMFIYPAEPIMGLYAIPTAVILYGNPLKARQVHCQKLWPSKLRGMVGEHGWIETHREFNLWKSPQFVSRFAATV